MTPQQKKQLSLARDCRNGYSENSKASRKAIPLRRAKKHRRYRRAVTAALSGAKSLDAVQSAVAEVRIDGWQKVSDVPLAEHIARKTARRVRSGQQPAG
jgi:hypothetical protein